MSLISTEARDARTSLGTGAGTGTGTSTDTGTQSVPGKHTGQ